MGPELGRANTEVSLHFGLVPENRIFQFVRLSIVIDHEALIVLRTLIHDLTEELEGRKGTAIVLVDTFAIGHVGFAQNKDIVHVGSEGRLNAEGELHRDQEKHFEPATVHEQIANILVVCPAVVVHTVVKNQEGAGIEATGGAPILFSHDFLHNEFLAFDKIRKNHGVVFAVNENGRNHLFEEAV